MATDPHAATPPASTWSASPIENELPTYRAISAWAVASLVLGLVSIATFASLTFLIASVGAIAAGAIALRSIRRYPELLTGAGLANVGIALGLISGLSAPTVSVVRHQIVGREARAVADQLVDALDTKGLAEAYWWFQPPSVRSQSTPQKILAESEANLQDPMGADARLSTLHTLDDRLATSDDQHIHVDEVESRGFNGVTPFANIRVMVDGPASDTFPAEQFALLRMEAADHEGRRQWYVSDLVYPYEPESRAQVVESAHGHDH